MIDELHATDLALIEHATLLPAAGLTVLTGETGAGKTALLSALKLLVGERGDATMVREGATGLLVEGRVFVDADDVDGTVVRRRLGADGRGRVEIDGAMASVHELAAKVGATVDLVGQHEHQRLLDVANHIEILDSFAGAPAHAAREHYQACLEAAAAAAAELARVRELVGSDAAAREEAHVILERIDEVNPREGELEELERTLPRIEHAETLIRAAEAARALLAGNDDETPYAIELIEQAARELTVASGHDSSLASFADILERARIDLDDVAASLRAYRDSFDFDPQEFDVLQNRMSALRLLMRSYGPSMSEVFARRSAAQELVDAAGSSELVLAEARRVQEMAEQDLAAAADELDAVRAEAGPRLCAAIQEHMARLEMGSAGLELSSVRKERSQWGPAGPSLVELLYKPAAGMAARPLRRIASGGEMSRVMLAAKLVLGEADPVDTLVFDEVDAGVGGATAVSLAQVIADLAKSHQVIVVTHLAQVAVHADVHYLVSKDETGTMAHTTISQIEGDARVAEIARMLSGDTAEASLAHAREMLGM